MAETSFRRTPPAFRPIESERLLLRLFRLSDLPDVQEYAADPQVTRFLRWGPNREEETLAFLRGAIRRGRAPGSNHFDLAVVERSSGRVCGGLGIHARAPQRVEVGYVLARGAWGRGYATEAVRAALPFAASGLGAHEVFALVLPENAASVRVLTRCGFRAASDPAAYDAWRSGICATARVYRRPCGLGAPGSAPRTVRPRPLAGSRSGGPGVAREGPRGDV